LFDVRRILQIEQCLEKKYKDEKTLILNKDMKTSASIEEDRAENNLKKGSLLRISSIFNGEKNEICDLMNDFSIYGFLDENIVRAEADNYYNKTLSNNNNKFIQTQYYSIIYKEKFCYGKRRKINKQSK